MAAARDGRARRGRVAARPAVLDVCAGTLDLAALAAGAGAEVVATDFSHAMLASGRGKVPVPVVRADALALPFSDAQFDGLICGFGLRNLDDTLAGLAEMRRVLKPGGRAVVLDFFRPRRAVTRAVQALYNQRVLPLVGGLVSGDRGAYRYLADSIERFATRSDVERMCREVGFGSARSEDLTLGIASMVVASCGRNRPLKLVVAVGGASGAPYARRLLSVLSTQPAEVVETHLVFSKAAHQVWAEEIGTPTADLPFKKWDVRDFNAPFASGSAGFGAMVVIPCSMGGLARIAHGLSEDLIGRAADVMLKERRKLILVARDTPLSLIHLENMTAVTRAGALLLPAMPSFYGRPQTIDALLDTVVGRVLDHLGLPIKLGPRWGEARRTSVNASSMMNAASLAEIARQVLSPVEAPASFVHSQLLSPEEPESDDVDEWLTLDVDTARRLAEAGDRVVLRWPALTLHEAPRLQGISVRGDRAGRDRGRARRVAARARGRARARRRRARGAGVRRHRDRLLSRRGGDAAQPRHRGADPRALGRSARRQGRGAGVDLRRRRDRRADGAAEAALQAGAARRSARGRRAAEPGVRRILDPGGRTISGAAA